MNPTPTPPDPPRPAVVGSIGPNLDAPPPPDAPVPAEATGRPAPGDAATLAPDAVATPRTPTQLSREQILDATAACLEDLGYDGTTIRRIAKQLDCAVGSIYRYFDDKRALLAAVIQRRFEPVLDRIEHGAPAEASAGLYVEIARDQPELYRLMFWLASVGRNADAPTLPAVVQKVIERWARQHGDPAAAEALWARVHGAILLGRSIDDLHAAGR
ncbi:MAG: TetR/AcrR family transcriptional regulator [Planctomycetota bacterium]